MKIRVGYGLGTGGLTGGAPAFCELVDGLEALGFDSLWLSERLTGAAPDPIVGMAVAAGRTERIKFGTSVLVLPGRNPAVLAKELATLDVLSRGRLLPAFGLGVADPAEQQAFGVQRGERAAWVDEVVPLLRKLWTGEPVDHDGARFRYEGLRVLPRPAAGALDVWLGGRAPSELRRIGRIADGWLPSFCTADDVREGRKLVEEAAAAAGRAIDPEHFGALVPYVRDAMPERIAAAVEARRPGVDVGEVVPSGLGAVRAHLERLVDAGASKFVLVPAFEPESWTAELESVAAAVLPLQTR